MRSGVFVAGALACLTAAGCGEKHEEAAIDAFAAVTMPVAPPSDPVIARVNGVTVHESEARARALQRGLPPGDTAKTAALVDDLVLEDLLSAEARRLGLDADPVARHAARRAMVQKLIDEEFEAKERAQPIPDAMLRRAYDKNHWYYNRPELRGFEHFFVQAKRSEPHERQAAAEAFAKEMLAGVLARQPKALADVHDEWRKRAAAAGFVVRYEEAKESRMKLEKEFADLLFTLPEGKIAERVVRSQYGFHIVRTVSVAKAIEQPFETVKDDVAKNFQAQYRQLRFRKWLTELRQKYGAKVRETANLLFREPEREASAPGGARPQAGGR